MSSPNRKRVTKTGKGAFSLYLPKRWIDQWSKEQLKERRVDLQEVGDHLIISPIIKGSFQTGFLEHGDEDEIRQFLLCSYVQGYESAELRSEGFSDEQMSAARNFVRLLDERLILDVREESIGYGRDFKVNMDSPSVDQLQRLLFEKLHESLRLSKELIAHLNGNRNRTIHLLHTLRTLEEEDIDRVAMQIMRRASRMEITFHSFPDLFYTVLTTDLLEKLGDAIFGIAEGVCDLYGLDKGRLSFPMETILEEMDVSSTLGLRNLQRTKEAYMREVEQLEEHLRRTMDIVLNRRGEAAYRYMEEIDGYHSSLKDRLAGLLAGSVSDSEGEPRNELVRIGYDLQQIASLTGDLVEEVAMFYFSDDLEDRT
ncbi:MAG: hypothetical protein ACLFS6_03455 [Methanomassiliicoccales archaeon]